MVDVKVERLFVLSAFGFWLSASAFVLDVRTFGQFGRCDLLLRDYGNVLYYHVRSTYFLLLILLLALLSYDNVRSCEQTKDREYRYNIVVTERKKKEQQADIKITNNRTLVNLLHHLP